jgi:hypothetical protein
MSTCPASTKLRVARAPWRAGVLRQVLLIALALAAYLIVRSVTQGATQAAEEHARDVLHVERLIGLDWESGAQALILEWSALVRFFDYFYVWTFWPILAATLVVLYRRDRGRYAQFRDALFISGAVGLVVFALFPVAPPRFLEGFTDTVGQLSGQKYLAHPSGFTNEYAAMPSFHVGWTLLASLSLFRVVRHRAARGLVLVPGVLVALAVVVTANHYVLDAVAGAFVALGGLALARAGHRVFGRPQVPEAPRRAPAIVAVRSLRRASDSPAVACAPPPPFGVDGRRDTSPAAEDGPLSVRQRCG